MRQLNMLVLVGLVACGPALAQEAIRNRSVRIIEDGAPLESVIPGRPDALRPSAKVQPPLPAADAPVPAGVQSEATSDYSTAAPIAGKQRPVTTPPVLSASDRTFQNDAGVKLDLMPGNEISVGAQMSVQVTTQKPGYLIVVDVDSEGHLTQIYPNTQSLATKEGASPTANFLQKGKPRIIPDPKERATFQFVAAPPLGVGMLVAILSDTPVQVMDLPDVPGLMAGQKPALDYVRETTRQLKILPSNDKDGIRDPKWSFATQFYVIK